MDAVTLEELIEYSQDIEIEEEIDFYDGLVLSYSPRHTFDIMYMVDDIDWKKENGHNYLPLEILRKYMEKNGIEECYVVE